MSRANRCTGSLGPKLLATGDGHGRPTQGCQKGGARAPPRGFRTEFAADSPLEGSGFEPSVPLRTERPWGAQVDPRDLGPDLKGVPLIVPTSRLATPSRAFCSGGTDGSNPLPSSRQSVSLPQ